MKLTNKNIVNIALISSTLLVSCHLSASERTWQGGVSLGRTFLDDLDNSTVSGLYVGTSLADDLAITAQYTNIGNGESGMTFFGANVEYDYYRMSPSSSLYIGSGLHYESSQHAWSPQVELGARIQSNFIEYKASIKGNYLAHNYTPDGWVYFLNLSIGYKTPAKVSSHIEEPEQPETVVIDLCASMEPARVYFAHDQAKPLAGVDSQWLAIANNCDVNKYKMVINGYASSVGTAEYNQRLSLQRAQEIEANIKEKISLDTEVNAHGSSRKFSADSRARNVTLTIEKGDLK